MKQSKKDIIKARGVGLKESEWKELGKIAFKHELTMNAVSAHGLRYFLKAYQAGIVKIETVVRQVVKE